MSEISEILDALPDIDFTGGRTLDGCMAEGRDYFCASHLEDTGKERELSKAEDMYHLLNACAYMWYQALQMVDRGAKMSLLKYSYGDYLANVVPMKGLSRSSGSAAVTTLRFTLSAARDAATTIPEGTRAADANQATFATTEAAEIPAGETYADIPAECVETGAAANGIGIGEICTLVDPVGYVASVTNLTKTQGGADEEDDDGLKWRFYKYPATYSSSGTKGSYEYFAKAASGDVADVLARDPEPGSGRADIRVLLEGGELPDSALLESILDYVTEKDVKNLTDQVEVSAPDAAAFTVDFTYYIAKSKRGQAESIQTAVEAAAKEYAEWQQASIGRDVNPDELVARCKAAGAKRLVIRSPAFAAVGNTAVAQLAGMTATYGGLEDD